MNGGSLEADCSRGETWGAGWNRWYRVVGKGEHKEVEKVVHSPAERLPHNTTVSVNVHLLEVSNRASSLQVTLSLQQQVV